MGIQWPPGHLAGVTLGRIKRRRDTVSVKKREQLSTGRIWRPDEAVRG